MLCKILYPLGLGSKFIIKYKFGSTVSWKRIRDKVFERQKYFKDYQMQGFALKIDEDKYKIYISPRSPEVVRTGESNYRILEDNYNFNMTFLDNLDYMGKQFTWNNRKNIGVNFRDILDMQNVTVERPIIITQQYDTTYNNETTHTIKQLKIQVLQKTFAVKISFSIVSSGDGDKWLGVYEISWNDYQFLIQSAKKNIYYSSGLKTMIELQKRQIIRQMDKRVINNKQKQLRSTIEYDIDKTELLHQMKEYQQELQNDKQSDKQGDKQMKKKVYKKK